VDISNTGDACEQERTAQAREVMGSTNEQGLREKILIGHEIVSSGETLKQVGKPVDYKGGFKFSPGSSRYLEMTNLVAKMARKVGIDLRRPGNKKAASLLLGLPDGEFLGRIRRAFKHDRRLPSASLVDSTQTSANLQYFYESELRGRGQLAALTFPALISRISIDNLDDGINLAFKRYKKLQKWASDNGAGKFLYCQLEMLFDEETKTLYLHFHVFLEIGLGEHARSNSLKKLKSGMHWLGSFAGVYLKVIDPKDVARSIRYGTKPCEAAYQIAKSGDQSTLKSFSCVRRGNDLHEPKGL
jgi:hypothetical protein